jgi:hypothetical protein
VSPQPLHVASFSAMPAAILFWKAQSKRSSKTSFHHFVFNCAPGIWDSQVSPHLHRKFCFTAATEFLLGSAAETPEVLKFRETRLTKEIPTQHKRCCTLNSRLFENECLTPTMMGLVRTNFIDSCCPFDEPVTLNGNRTRAEIPTVKRVISSLSRLPEGVSR